MDEEMFNSIEGELKEVVKKCGFRVDIDSKFCCMRQEKNLSCSSCESLIGCRKLSDIRDIVLLAHLIMENMQTADSKKKILKGMTETIKGILLRSDGEQVALDPLLEKELSEVDKNNT